MSAVRDYMNRIDELDQQIEDAKQKEDFERARELIEVGTQLMREIKQFIPDLTPPHTRHLPPQ